MPLMTSARARLVTAVAVMSSLAIALVLALVYWMANTLIDGETRSVVDAELKGLAENYTDLGVLGLARAIDRRVENNDEPDALYLLTDRFGQPLAGNLKAWPSDVKPGSGWVEIDLIRTDRDETVPIAAASIRLRGNERLLVGRDASVKEQFESALWRAALFSLVAAIIVSLVVGWLLTRAVFGRIGAISTTASEIMSGDLSRRMPSGAGADEMDQLANTLNAMLDRIEELVSNLRMTTDSLSHDLRSPLTRLHAHIDHLTREDISEQERLTVSGRALNEIDRILSVFSSLTEIARADAGIGRSEFQRIDLADVAHGMANLYQPVIEEQGVTIRAETHPAVVFGSKPLLEQVFSNLIENALRFAPEGSELSVSTSTDRARAMICVGDRGVGIPEAERKRVLQPFVTLEKSRANGTSGLGLALVASVVRLHSGEIMLEDNSPGLRVVIDLPQLASASEE